MIEHLRPNLRALADHYGILPHYIDTAGVRRETTDATYVALLECLGSDASSEEAAARALTALEARARERLIEPTKVLRTRASTVSYTVRVAPLSTGAWRWSLEVTEESGAQHQASGRGTVRDVSLTLRSGVRLPHGYHAVRLELQNGHQTLTATQHVIVAPVSCVPFSQRTHGKRLYGLIANLYTVRSEQNWGAGDLGDVDRLVRWSATVGASFVGLNPLHALRNRGWDISPYYPISRLYRNPLYLDVTAIPEFHESDAARALIGTTDFVESLIGTRTAEVVQYESVMKLKTRALRALHQVFVEQHAQEETDRWRAYRTFCRAQGAPLEAFAVFAALDDHMVSEDGAPPDWRAWPDAYRDPRSPAVVEFRERSAEDVDYHRWVQFEIDRQLAMLAGLADSEGLPLGLYGDLAVGSSPGGCDPWVFKDLFVSGASVGAPPDDYAAGGQVWGLPPLHPHRGAEDGYRYWRLLVQNAMRHFGALRIDHVMGLFRMFWIPDGLSGTEGAYVRYPADDLLGILALESTRHGTLVIGEDLGTVPKGLPATLARRGILSTRVLYFERNRHGEFRPSNRYSKRALVSASTHDHAPVSGYWEGRDLTLRRQAGSIPTDAVLELARATREADRTALVDRLRRERLLPEATPDASAITTAVHRFLARTPSPLVAISLDDLAGETDPVNLPGVHPDAYPCWSRRMHLTLKRLEDRPIAHESLVALSARSFRRPPNSQ